MLFTLAVLATVIAAVLVTAVAVVLVAADAVTLAVLLTPVKLLDGLAPWRAVVTFLSTEWDTVR